MKKLLIFLVFISYFFIGNANVNAYGLTDEFEFDEEEEYIAPELLNELYYYQRQMRDAEKRSVLAYEDLLLFLNINDAVSDEEHEIEFLANRFFGKKLLLEQQITRDKINAIAYSSRLTDVHYAANKYAEAKIKLVKKMLKSYENPNLAISLQKEQDSLAKATAGYKEELQKISGSPGKIFRPLRDLEITDCYIVMDQYNGGYIEGAIKNNTLKTFNSVQITFHSYDSNSRKVGMSETFTPPITGKSTYVFRTPFTTEYFQYIKLMKFRATEITSHGNVVISLI